MSISILAWIILALPLIALAAIVTLVLRRRATAPGVEPRPLALAVTRVVAIGYAVMTAAVTTITVLVTLLDDAIGVALPVREFWPGVYPWITLLEGPSATITGGGFTLAEVTVSGLGMDARLPLAAGQALQGATFTVIAIVVALLCHRLLAGEAFGATLSRSISLTAVAIAAGGILWQACFWIGGNIASAQALEVGGWSSDDPGAADPFFDTSAFDPWATGLPQPTIAFQIDFWPLFLGLALAAVAAAFRYGERLQRDTLRLQLDTELLRRETGGLI